MLHKISKAEDHSSFSIVKNTLLSYLNGIGYLIVQIYNNAKSRKQSHFLWVVIIKVVNGGSSLTLKPTSAEKQKKLKSQFEWTRELIDKAEKVLFGTTDDSTLSATASSSSSSSSMVAASPSPTSQLSSTPDHNVAHLIPYVPSVRSARLLQELGLHPEYSTQLQNLMNVEHEHHQTLLRNCLSSEVNSQPPYLIIRELDLTKTNRNGSIWQSRTSTRKSWTELCY